MLIGPLKVPSLQSRIKVNVDHAGLSPPLVLWKDLAKSPGEPFKASLNNNLLTAQVAMETKPATVV